MNFKLKNEKGISFTAFVLTDYLAVLFATFSAQWLRGLFLGRAVIVNDAELYVLMPLFFFYLQYTKRLYKSIHPFWQNMGDIFRNCFLLVVGLVLYQYAHHEGIISRFWAVAFFFILYCTDITARFFVRLLLKKYGCWKYDLLLFCKPEEFDSIRERINRTDFGYQIYNDRLLPMDIEQILKHPIKDYLFAPERENNGDMLRWMQKLQPYSTSTYYMLDAGDELCANLEIESFADTRIAMVKVKNLLCSMRISVMKRCFDFCAAIIGSVLISPLLAYISYRIRKDSPGPVIYDGWRIGQNGTLFKCYKFRSMYVNGDEMLEKYFADHPEKKTEWEQYHKLDDDPRVTPFGAFMRRTSLDELPQLLNVIKGQMSLVGPRPYLEREIAEMGDAMHTIVLAKPGITGYWQVNGRSDVTFQNRVKMDCWYIGNWSLWLDLTLLVKTVGIVLKKKGAK